MASLGTAHLVTAKGQFRGIDSKEDAQYTHAIEIMQYQTENFFKMATWEFADSTTRGDPVADSSTSWA